MEKIHQYFQSHPTRQEVHKTADGMLFHELSDALNHKKEGVKTFKKDALGLSIEPVNMGTILVVDDLDNPEYKDTLAAVIEKLQDSGYVVIEKTDLLQTHEMQEHPGFIECLDKPEFAEMLKGVIAKLAEMDYKIFTNAELEALETGLRGDEASKESEDAAEINKDSAEKLAQENSESVTKTFNKNKKTPPKKP